MKKIILSVLSLIFGFLVCAVFSQSSDWFVVSVMGGVFAGFGLSNLSLIAFPNRKTILDWVGPAITLLVLTVVLVTLQANSYFGVQGSALVLIKALAFVLCISPAFRLFQLVMVSQKLVDDF